jgi:hypothetical protein
MSEREPLDLRALGDVDSPEVVREALAKFRRRIVTRYVWLVVLAGLLVAGVIWGRTPTDLVGRVDRAGTATIPTRTWRLQDSTLGIDRVVDLGDTIGLRLEVLPDPSARGSLNVSATGEVGAEGLGRWTRYLEVTPPPDGIVMLTVRQGRLTEHVAVDLRSLGVSSSYWKG